MINSNTQSQFQPQRLQNNRAAGPLRMRADDLKGWIAAARREEKKGETAEK